MNKKQSNESYETEVTEAWGLFRTIISHQERCPWFHTASVTISSHSHLTSTANDGEFIQHQHTACLLGFFVLITSQDSCLVLCTAGSVQMEEQGTGTVFAEPQHLFHECPTFWLVWVTLSEGEVPWVHRKGTI